MRIYSKKGLVLVAALAAASMAPALAHESRIIPATTGSGSFRLSVGFAVEPAFEDSYNGVDVILNTWDGPCSGGYFGAPIDPARTPLNPGDAKDSVALTVEALYLAAAEKPGGQIGEIPPGGILKRLVLTDASPLGPKFGTPGTFNTFFRPTHPGFYGFHVYGTVAAGPNLSTRCPGSSAPLAARTASFNVYFVCSAAGSFSPPSSFNCVQTPQAFPGGPMAPYKPNREPHGHGALND